MVSQPRALLFWTHPQGPQDRRCMYAAWIPWQTGKVNITLHCDVCKLNLTLPASEIVSRSDVLVPRISCYWNKTIECEVGYSSSSTLASFSEFEFSAT